MKKILSLACLVVLMSVPFGMAVDAETGESSTEILNDHSKEVGNHDHSEYDMAFTTTIDGQVYYSNVDLSNLHVGDVSPTKLDATSKSVQQLGRMSEYHSVTQTSNFFTGTGRAHYIWPDKPTIHRVTQGDFYRCSTVGHTDEIFVERSWQDYEVRATPCPW